MNFLNPRFRTSFTNMSKTIVTHVPTEVYETTSLPGQTQTTEVVDYTTLTSLCPYTTTKTEGGSTYTQTLTSTETIVTKVPTQIAETTWLPDQTKTTEVLTYTTLTSLCPYYTTVTEGGQVVTHTLTSTDTIVTQVPQTISATVWTTSLTTAYETTDIYVTESCPVTQYTTVVQVCCPSSLNRGPRR